MKKNKERTQEMSLPVMYEEPIYWEKMMLLYESALEEMKAKIEVLNKEFKLRYGYTPIEHISYRTKSPKSIVNKLKKNNLPLYMTNIVKHVNDVAGIRIICSYTSEIYTLASLIENQDNVKVLKIKDYVAEPKPNGYQSYHMIVSVPVYLSDSTVYTKVEIQLRTVAMDCWASLEHKMHYKFAGESPEHIARELKECADIVAFLDRKMMSINDEIQRYNKNTTEKDNEYDETSEYLVEEMTLMFGDIIEDESN